MLQLLNLLVDICLLRRPPQALPARRVLTVLTLVAYATVAAAAESWLGDPAQALPWSLVSITLLVILIQAMLRVRGYPERFDQTTSAIAGCGVIYLLLYVPLTAALSVPEDGTGAQPSILLLLAWIVLFFWGFLIEGHIYRHALRLSLPAGVLISALIFAGANVLYRQFFITP